VIPGLGAASARRLLDAIAGADDPLQALRTFKPPPAAAADWRTWLSAHEALCAAAWPEAIAQARRWYEPHLERLHEDATIRRADLAQLERLAAQYPSRERFLAELTLDPPEATSDAADEPHRDEDYLILSTLHSAKGQEWSAVHILNAVDGCMPADLATGHADDIEEERRLLYVGMTRAKHHLTLWVPLRFHVTQQSAGGDRHLYGSLTRFIPQDLAQRHFDRVVPVSSLAAETPSAALPSIDLLARVRRAF
jgi:DNA helicase II / ATP-dependent DNA helicase PcrA